MRSRAPARLISAIAAVAILLVGCGPGTGPAGPQPTAGGPATLGPGTLVRLGEVPLRVAVADDFARGLAGRDDLGGLDGMLFDYGQDVAPAAHPFWMRGVRFALDIRFFAADGRLVDEVQLEPCSADPCPAHVAAAPFRWVLETVAGRVAAPAGARLTVDGG